MFPTLGMSPIYMTFLSISKDLVNVLLTGTRRKDMHSFILRMTTKLPMPKLLQRQKDGSMLRMHTTNHPHQTKVVCILLQLPLDFKLQQSVSRHPVALL